MQFDKTYIAIRKRDLVEILDLTMHVIRDHITPLCILWWIGCVPFFLFNWYCLQPLSVDYYDPERLILYGYMMCLLVNNQSHISSLFVTNYLGQCMFSDKPTTWQAIKSTLATNKFVWWVHGGLRMVFPVMIVSCFFNDNMRDDDLAVLVFWLSLMALIGLIVRMMRPFASEILALEKTPVLKKKDGQITYSVRSKSLHKAAGSEMSGRFFMVSIFSLPLTGAILGSLLIIDSTLSLHSSSDTLPSVFYLPIALWIVSGILAVARFLSYIDIRIRQEGWEVELKIRSEALKLEKVTG